MKRFMKVCLMLVLTLTLVACQKQETSEKKIKIGVTVYDQYDTFISEMMEDFNHDLASYGSVSVEIMNASKSQKTQNKQVEKLIDDGCDVVCVNLVDRTEPTKIIDLARNHNIPIIFFNRELVEEDLMKWDRLYYVGANAEESGILQGRLAVQAFEKHPEYDRNHDGMIQYYILEGEAGHQDAIVRTERCVDAIVQSGHEVDKLGSSIANWNKAQAQSKIALYLEQHHEPMELLLANNDDMAIGAIEAFEQANIPQKDWPLIFGIDGTRVGIQAVKDGKLSGTVFNDQQGQAEQMAKLAMALCNQEKMSDLKLKDGKYIRLPYSPITIENVKDYQTH